MPQYHFVVRALDQYHDDPSGLILWSDEAARAYAYRIVRELRDGGYDPPGAVLQVRNHAGVTILSIPF